jgi:hypothetical protein
MPDLPKTKLSEKPVATNLLPGDRLVVLRRGQDEPDAARRNLTAPLAVVQAWLGISSATQHLVAPAMLLAAAQATLAAGEPFDEGVQYPLIGDWNAVGDGDQVVYLHTASTTQFRTNGTLFRFGHAPQEVLVDVAAGTAVASGVDAYTVAETDALLATKGDLAVQQQHTQQLATLGVQGSPVYGYLEGGQVVGYATLDEALADPAQKTLMRFNVATVTVTKSNAPSKPNWAYYADGAGATLQLAEGVVLSIGGEDRSSLQMTNFFIYTAPSARNARVKLLASRNTTTPIGQLPYISALCSVPLELSGGAVVLTGYYTNLTGTGTVYALEPFQCNNVGAGVTVVRAGAGAGTVKTVNGVAPDASGAVVLPQLDLYGYSAAKRSQVFGLFTTANQVKAVDVALAGDSSTSIGSRIPDLSNGAMYELVADPDNPMAGLGGAVIGTPTWLRY